MANQNKTSNSVSTTGNQSDMEIVTDIMNKYYFITDSTLVNFQRKAKEELSVKAEEVLKNISNRGAKKLLKTIIDRYS